jgi:type I restriction enzyme S subunit
MKDSGIPWIGEIPKHWANAKYRYSGVFVKGKLPNEQNVEQLGKPIIGASEMLGKECRNFSLDTNVPTCQKQDVLILWDGANAGIVANNCEGIVSSTAVKYMCTDRRFDSQYLFYLFKNGEPFFKSKVNGTTIPHMNQKYIDEYLCIQPPLAEQQRIAEFLDRKCAEVDEMIALQEQIIEELKAYKQSVITEAVTKGLNPAAPMRDSGIDWIGSIPEHWETKRLKHLSQVVRGGSPRPAGDERFYNGNIPFMKVADITKDDSIYVNSCEYTIKEAGLNHTRMINPNTLLLTNSGATLGVPKINTFITTFNDGIAAFLNLDKGLDIIFAYYSLKARTQYFLDSASLGIGQPNLNTDIIGSVYLLIPPLYEQKDIVDYLDDKCADIDSLIQTKQSKIDSLKEYKKSIIYEYVTGKREVNE